MTPNERLVWTGALGPGFRPQHSDMPFTAIIELQPTATGGTRTGRSPCTSRPSTASSTRTWASWMAGARSSTNSSSTFEAAEPASSTGPRDPMTTVDANGVALGIESFGDPDAALVLLARGRDDDALVARLWSATASPPAGAAWARYDLGIRSIEGLTD